MTSKNISAMQNSEDMLQRVAARKVLYGYVGNIQLLQAGIPIINALVWPLLLWRKPELGVWSALCGFLIPLFNEVSFETLLHEWKSKAARIQELFDCDLLSIEWNPLVVGRKPGQEMVLCYAKRLAPKYESTLKDWYPAGLDDVPIEYARLICQRANFWWDSNLRESFARLLLILMWGVVIIAVLYGVANDLKLTVVVTNIVAPLAPALLWGMRERRHQLKAYYDGKNLMEQVEDTLEKGVSGRLSLIELATHSRSIQDGLFRRRSESPANPDLIYNYFHEDYEERMKKAAEKMVEGYKSRISR